MMNLLTFLLIKKKYLVVRCNVKRGGGFGAGFGPGTNNFGSGSLGPNNYGSGRIYGSTAVKGQSHAIYRALVDMA